MTIKAIKNKKILIILFFVLVFLILVFWSLSVAIIKRTPRIINTIGGIDTINIIE